MKRYWCETCKSMQNFLYTRGLFSGYFCEKCHGMHNTGQDDDE